METYLRNKSDGDADAVNDEQRYVDPIRMIFAEPSGPDGNDNYDHGHHDAHNNSNEKVDLPLKTRQPSFRSAGKLCESAENGAVTGADDNANSRARDTVSAGQADTGGFKEVVISLPLSAREPLYGII